MYGRLIWIPSADAFNRGRGALSSKRDRKGGGQVILSFERVGPAKVEVTVSGSRKSFDFVVATTASE